MIRVCRSAGDWFFYFFEFPQYVVRYGLFFRIMQLRCVACCYQNRIGALVGVAAPLGNLREGVASLIESGKDLTELPGVGADLAGKIQQIVETGQSPFLTELRKKSPGSLIELLKVPGLGPKRVKTLYKELRVRSLQELTRAAQDGRLQQLPGFGKKLEQQVFQAVQSQVITAKRMRISVAGQYADAIVHHLKQAHAVSKVVVADSFRRCRETVGDLDILVTGQRDSDVIAHFIDFPEIARVLSQGTTRASIVLKSGLQVDLR